MKATANQQKGIQEFIHNFFLLQGEAAANVVFF
jgi:hypothetical protein